MKQSIFISPFVDLVFLQPALFMSVDFTIIAVPEPVRTILATDGISR